MSLTKPRAHQLFDIDYKQSVRVLTDSDISLSGGAPSTVDGVELALRDRVLVIGQSTASQNGLYYVTTVGTGSNGTWQRSQDAAATGEILAGTIVMVTEGTVYADTQWKLTTDNPIVVGTTALTWEQNSAFAFGNIYANGTAVLANTVGDTVTLTAGNNIAITGNASAKSVTIAVTGISLNSISNGTSNVNIPTANGNVTTAVNGNNILTVSSSGATVTGSVTTTGNIRSTGAINSFGDLVGNATFASASARSLNLVGTDAVMRVARANPNQFSPAVELLDLNANTGATLSYWDFFAAGSTDSFTLRRRTGGANDFVLTANSAGVQFPTGAVTITGNVSGGNVTTAGQVVATGNVSGSNIIGNGSSLSGINAFGNIVVSGQSTVSSDSTSDTLTFAPGPGISIVTDAANNVITIGSVSTESIFATGGDMGTVDEAVTAEEDLGLVTDAATVEFDLGTIVTSGVLYPDQLVLPLFTVAELANTSTNPAGQLVLCSNDVGGAVPAFSDGTDWRRVTDRQIVS